MPDGWRRPAQVRGFMGLVEQKPPSGAVLRVTLRKRGTEVAHDLVSYGREMGGPNPSRPGLDLFKGDLSKL